mgnify:CR=1 FL=1
MQAEIKKLPSGMFGIYVNGNQVDEAYSIGDANRKLEILLGGPTIREDHVSPPQRPSPPRRNKPSNAH